MISLAQSSDSLGDALSDSAIVQLRHISKSYSVKNKSTATPVLKDISFSVSRGRIFGIIGRSGAGKSTLLRLINYLDQPDQGDVVVDGDILSELSNPELRQKRQKIGIIFQHFNLISTKTVFENIALPLQFLGVDPSQINVRVQELLLRVGLENFANRYPESLSGGQRQRVAIARSLATAPKLLLCDEATSALDPESTHSILKLLQSLNRELGLTIILITHEMSVIKSICHDVAVLDHGELIELGSVLQVFSQPKHPVTRALTQKAFHLELPELFACKVTENISPGSYPLFRMTFVGHAASEPMSVILFERFNVKVNILQADVEYFCDTQGDVQVGFLLSQLVGEPEAIVRAVSYLKEQGVSTEGVGYVAL